MVLQSCYTCTVSLVAEAYWEAVTMSRPPTDPVNDQIRLNYGLDVLHITWRGRTRNELHSEVVGTCKNELTATVLPYNVICRYGCQHNRRKQYYIWHKGGNRDKRSKKAGAEQGHTWFLKNNWKEISHTSSLKGQAWLRYISNTS